MRFTKNAAAVAAMLALCAAPTALNAQSAQTTDRSGAITLQFTVAKWVEVVSHAPSTHNLTASQPEGVAPGQGSIDTPDGMVTREIKANTAYRLTLQGLSANGDVEFIAGQAPPGTGIMLKMQCRLSATEHPSAPSEYADWLCSNSGPLVPTNSSWVTLRAYTENASVTANRRAGLYQATVYLQIEAL
ncbi:MAG: hypothetical protein JWM27_3109 [Gemmatimonadetes bacterium]|nr:hypothetical protein [Gemmatimonadota bacterium]